jgi:hypothetical protein
VGGWCAAPLDPSAGGSRTSSSGYSGPRLHDLRRTFAIRTLLDWHREGVDRGPLFAAERFRVSTLELGVVLDLHQPARLRLIDLVLERVAERNLGGPT